MHGHIPKNVLKLWFRSKWVLFGKKYDEFDWQNLQKLVLLLKARKNSSTMMSGLYTKLFEIGNLAIF